MRARIWAQSISTTCWALIRTRMDRGGRLGHTRMCRRVSAPRIEVVGVSRVADFGRVDKSKELAPPGSYVANAAPRKREKPGSRIRQGLRVRVGVLRLRSYCATRSSRSAQEDRGVGRFLPQLVRGWRL